jgi:hypothetical protein
MVPNELLAQFFIRLGLGDLDIKWSEIGEREPEPITYQLELLRRVGFAHVELLHKNSCFAAFGAWKE